MGQVKAMWMKEQEMNELKVERTPIVEAWAFKGRVYAKAFIDAVPGGNLRKLVMYRLISRDLSDERAEATAAKILETGDVDLFLWDEVKTMWEGEGGGKPSREDLIAEGKRTGVCQVCHRKLTNPDSIAAGIGPVCAGRV
jgi:hypothetical protein